MDRQLTVFAQGELEHRRVKRLYARTNKNTRFPAQIALLQQRQAFFESRRRARQGTITAKRPTRVTHTTTTTHHPLRKKIAQADLAFAGDAAAHHHISEDTRDTVNLAAFIYETPENRACKVRTELYSGLNQTETTLWHPELSG